MSVFLSFHLLNLLTNIFQEHFKAKAFCILSYSCFFLSSLLFEQLKGIPNSKHTSLTISQFSGKKYITEKIYKNTLRILSLSTFFLFLLLSFFTFCSYISSLGFFYCSLSNFIRIFFPFFRVVS